MSKYFLILKSKSFYFQSLIITKDYNIKSNFLSDFHFSLATKETNYISLQISFSSQFTQLSQLESKLSSVGLIGNHKSGIGHKENNKKISTTKTTIEKELKMANNSKEIKEKHEQEEVTT